MGPCGIVSKCKPNDPITDSPVGSTETPDPVDQKEGPIQIDIMKIVTTDKPASSVGTPPSSDSGIHSWGEQWENMSISTTDTEAEQNGRPRIGIQTGRRVSDTCLLPNTEEDQVITFHWMDCLLNRDSDESSSPGIRNYDRDTRGNVDFHSDREPTSDESLWEDYEAASDISEIRSNEGGPVVPQTAYEYHIRNVAIYGIKNSSVGSGTDGRNSDIGDLADFSSDEEESQVEQISGCPIPGCQCEGNIEYMEWNYDDLSDSEDSEWEDPGQRSIRLSVERYNLDMTYTHPPRKNRRKRYENNVKNTPEVPDSISYTSEMGFRTDKELRIPQSEPALQLTTDAEEDIPSCRDKKENYGPQKLAGSDTDFPSIIPADLNCGEYSECFDRPVTESVMARAADTKVILVMNVSTVATEQLEPREMVLCETVKRGIPVNRAELTSERQRPENILPGALRHVKKMRNNQWNCADYCFGVCGKADSVN